MEKNAIPLRTLHKQAEPCIFCVSYDKSSTNMVVTALELIELNAEILIHAPPTTASYSKALARITTLYQPSPETIEDCLWGEFRAKLVELGAGPGRAHRVVSRLLEAYQQYVPGYGWADVEKMLVQISQSIKTQKDLQAATAILVANINNSQRERARPLDVGASQDAPRFPSHTSPSRKQPGDIFDEDLNAPRYQVQSVTEPLDQWRSEEREVDAQFNDTLEREHNNDVQMLEAGITHLRERTGTPQMDDKTHSHRETKYHGAESKLSRLDAVGWGEDAFHKAITSKTPIVDLLLPPNKFRRFTTRRDFVQWIMDALIRRGWPDEFRTQIREPTTGVKKDLAKYLISSLGGALSTASTIVEARSCIEHQLRPIFNANPSKFRELKPPRNL